MRHAQPSQLIRPQQQQSEKTDQKRSIYTRNDRTPSRVAKGWHDVGDDSDCGSELQSGCCRRKRDL